MRTGLSVELSVLAIETKQFQTLIFCGQRVSSEFFRIIDTTQGMFLDKTSTGKTINVDPNGSMNVAGKVISDLFEGLNRVDVYPGSFRCMVEDYKPGCLVLAAFGSFVQASLNGMPIFNRMKTRTLRISFCYSHYSQAIVTIVYFWRSLYNSTAN